MVLNFKEIYSNSWDVFKKNWIEYVVTAFIMTVLLFIPYIGGLLQFLMTILVINAVLKSVKGESINFSSFFQFKDLTNQKVAVIFIIISIYTLLIQSAGQSVAAALLSLLGFVFTILFFPLLCVMLDKDFDVKETFLYSRRLTKGALVDIVLIMIINAVIGVVGLLLFFVGIFVAMPVITISVVLTYMALDGKSDAVVDVNEVK